MRLAKLILFLAALLLLLPGTALAEPQEQLFLRQVSVGSFDVWQHTDGRWQDTDHDGKPDPYGLTNKTLKPEVFSLPQTQYTNGFTVTRVEIKYDFTLTDEELKNAGRSESWKEFKKKYLLKCPNNYKAEKTGEDLTQGTVTVQKTLDLMPELLDLKDPAVREELGMSDQDFSNLAQGWRWYTPVLINWYGVPKELQNLKVQITSIPSESPNAGASVTVKGLATNESDSPVTTLVQWYLDSKKIYEGSVTIDKTRNLTFPFVMPNKDTLVTVQINPGHNMPPNETTWKDNKDSVTVNLAAPVAQGNGQLILTAMSQAGSDVYGVYHPSAPRPTGTAKWTDTVTAKLTTQGAPDLGSCYNLKTWKLESATIYFPKQHPDFTFGSPYEPVGIESKQMTITGNRTATVQFRENWSLNGAEIYDMLKEQMVPGPTYYNVKVTYKMLWEYSKGHRACCGEEECNPCCKGWKDYTKHPTYTVTAKLLVNGTGVNSLAQ